MLHALDRNVGLILSGLDELGLRDNTIVVFTSDNGATKAGSNLPFQGSQHSVQEGKTRLPTVVHWPRGKVVAGAWDGFCGALDMFPTLMGMAGLTMPETRPLDGRNCWPALRDDLASPLHSCCWAWRNIDTSRTADWRLHRYFDPVELYGMRTDVSETTEIASENAAAVRTLTTGTNT
ncbi:MAG: hypothetical protein FJX11_19265 [Alphaproteobacteria bacterium]|nr:hypothetical protein [Alphaproteobacteria bacterium]MBM3987931.1 hypothetical protein [Planctomycetota bacterium]